MELATLSYAVALVACIVVFVVYMFLVLYKVCMRELDCLYLRCFLVMEVLRFFFYELEIGKMLYNGFVKCI